MWSRLNVVGLRRRWASREDDPGHQARERVFVSLRAGNGRRSRAEEPVLRSFLARDVVIDCPQRGCPGKLLTSVRQISRNGGMGSRVTLRCTRRPRDHAVTLSLAGYTFEESERIRGLHRRGERVQCARCGTGLVEGAFVERRRWLPERETATGDEYHCPWCGVTSVLTDSSACRTR